MRLRLALGALVLGFGSACVLVTNLGGLGADGGGVDGGADVGADTAPDASGNDGSTDAGFCASHPGHTICSDFDEPNPFSAWTPTMQPLDAGTLEVSDAFAVSPPFSLRAVARSSALSLTVQRLVRFVSPAPKHVHLELTMRACDLQTGIEPLVEIVCDSPSSKFGGVWLHLESGVTALRLHPPAGTTGYTENVVNVPNVTPGARKVVLDVVFDANGSVTYANDGPPIVAQTGIDTRCLANSTVEINLGAAVFQGGPECESFFDDVLVDVDP